MKTCHACGTPRNPGEFVRPNRWGVETDNKTCNYCSARMKKYQNKKRAEQAATYTSIEEWEASQGPGGGYA